MQGEKVLSVDFAATCPACGDRLCRYNFVDESSIQIYSNKRICTYMY